MYVIVVWLGVLVKLLTVGEGVVLHSFACLYWIFLFLLDYFIQPSCEGRGLVLGKLDYAMAG